MEKIEVPPLSISHIIGKGGANIKDLQNRSGAKCIVQGNYIMVTGSSDARRHAINLIQDCIDNSIAVYNHPLEAIIALRQPLIGLKSVKFVKYQGIMDEYNFNKAYFVLDKGEEIKDGEMDKNDNKSLENREITMSDIIAPKEDNVLILHMTKRLIEETNKSHDKFLDLKIKANLGKQLFYPSRKGIVELQQTYVPLNHLIKYKIGHKADVKTTFMNHLPIGIVEIIESYLKKSRYEKDNTIQRASIHVIDVEEKKRITISNDITPEGLLELRKCRPDNVSHLYLSFARPKSTLDFRFKVFSHKEPMEIVPSEIRRIIGNSICNLDEKTIRLPDTTKYRVTTIRVKIKRKFINNTGSKVTISNVYQEGRGDVQVTVANPRLHEVLAKMKNKEKSRNGKKLEEELKNKVEEFVDGMNRIVNEVQYNFS